VNIDNLGATINSLNDLTYSKFRVTDFHTDQTFDSCEIAKTVRFEELRDPNLDPEANQSAVILGYYMRKTTEFGWILENLKVPKNISGENSKKLDVVLSKFVKTSLNDVSKILMDPSTLTQEEVKKEPEFKKVDLLDRGKSLNTPVKAKLDLSKKPQEEKVEEKKEIPVERAKLCSRTFGPMELGSNDFPESIVRIIEDTIQKQCMDVYLAFEFGYDLTITGRPITKPRHALRTTELQSFTIKAKPKPAPIEIVAEVDPENPDGITLEDEPNND